MRLVAVALVAAFLVLGYLPLGLTFPSTAPALLWSPYQDGIKEAISYQTLSAKDLVESVMSKGGWSNYLCSGKEAHQPLDLVLIFVGGESLDISGNKHAAASMVELLRGSYAKSNFSLAFPYVAAAASEDRETIESSLVSALSQSCGQDGKFSDVAFLDSCLVEGDHFKKLSDSHSVNDYLVSSIAKGGKGQANLMVGCHKGMRSSRDVDQAQSESQMFSELISSVEETGAKYTVLYVSDPSSSSIRYPSSREIERFLAESSSSFGNSTTSCDGVCQIKSSLLEGLFVGIVLLIILISGLCCMMGIDTPTRFEAPQDS